MLTIQLVLRGIMHLRPDLPDPHAPSHVGRRSAARLRLAIPVRFMTTYETQACVLLDLSRSGARIGLTNPLNPGASGYLLVTRMEIFAAVVRRISGAVGGINGLEFDLPISDDAVIAVRRHAETFEFCQRAALRDQVRRWVTGST